MVSGWPFPCGGSEHLPCEMSMDVEEPVEELLQIH